MATFSSVAGMRKRKHALIDRQELDHCHRTIERIAEKKGPSAVAAAQTQHKRDRLSLTLGDRTPPREVPRAQVVPACRHAL